MTDAEWAPARPLLPVPVPGWMRGRGGQPEAYCHRAMPDAIGFLVDHGIKWADAVVGAGTRGFDGGKPASGEGV